MGDAAAIAFAVVVERRSRLGLSFILPDEGRFVLKFSSFFKEVFAVKKGRRERMAAVRARRRRRVSSIFRKRGRSV